MGLTLRTMLEWLVAISYVVEEVDLIFASKQGCADAVHGSVAPALVVKTTLLIKELEEFGVSLASPEVKVSDLKVAPN